MRSWLACLLLLSGARAALAADPESLLEAFDKYPHAVSVSSERREVLDYQIGLGPIQKRNGAWRLEESERLSGTLIRYTWQVVDGFSSAEVADDLVSKLGDATVMYQCEGRRCGPGVQWANRVFNQRILYGREENQRYQVFAIDGSPAYRVLVYNAARTIDRQYLHVEVLRIED
jgi:hypothetical protein